jgi:hypothetical protein
MTDTTHGVQLDDTTIARPAAPAGDDPTGSSLILDRTLNHVVAVIDDLRFVAERHKRLAPISSHHVETLVGLIALDTLTWIETWPA